MKIYVPMYGLLEVTECNKMLVESKELIGLLT